jgi:hypothetical protein
MRIHSGWIGAGLTDEALLLGMGRSVGRIRCPIHHEEFN